MQCSVLVVDLHVGALGVCLLLITTNPPFQLPPAQNRSLLNSHIRDASKAQYGEMTKWQLNWTCLGRGGRRVEKGNSRAECADGQLEHSASPVNCHYPSTAVCFIQIHCCKESAKSSGGILLYHLFASKNSTVGFWHCDPFHILVFDHTMHAKNSTPLLQERPPLPPTVLFCCPSLTLTPPKLHLMLPMKRKRQYNLYLSLLFSILREAIL